MLYDEAARGVLCNITSLTARGESADAAQP